MGSERVNLADEVATLPDVQLKVMAPRPVDVGLEQLVSDVMERARELREVTRGEIVGALLLGAARDASQLVDLVVAYRRARIHEVLPRELRTSGRVTLPPRRLGRPSRRSGSPSGNAPQIEKSPG